MTKLMKAFLFNCNKQQDVLTFIFNPFLTEQDYEFRDNQINLMVYKQLNPVPLKHCQVYKPASDCSCLHP